jgi:patatin-like phospholipase/acyl hydrolase
VAGTSTGGILALGLTVAGEGGSPRWTARELVSLYEREGPKIFETSLFQKLRSLGGLEDEKYSSEPLRTAPTGLPRRGPAQGRADRGARPRL